MRIGYVNPTSLEAYEKGQSQLDHLRNTRRKSGALTETARRISVMDNDGSNQVVEPTTKILKNGYASRSVDGKGGRVLYNPDEVITFKDGPNKEYSHTTSPESVLAHELAGHLYQHSSGESDSDIGLESENDAIQVENEIRAMQGLPLIEWRGKQKITDPDKYSKLLQK